MALTQVSSNKCCEGYQKVFEHESKELKCKMRFGIYLPPKAENGKCPVLYWLSGLTCTEQNFITKSAGQQVAAEHGIIIVVPDTSPRGCCIEGEDDSWDFGTGAGFYVDATEEPWKRNYRMYSYITDELPRLISASFPVIPEKMSIFGHSMGGHGALICALKNPGKYKTVSAFSPICNPMQCPWGQKAFIGYLGSDQSKWEVDVKDPMAIFEKQKGVYPCILANNPSNVIGQSLHDFFWDIALWILPVPFTHESYDATCLAAAYSGPTLDILIDQGKDDQFLAAGQLLPDNLIAACTEKKIPVVFRLQQGYDHSYFFISTFIGDHIKHHAKYLNA